MMRTVTVQLLRTGWAVTTPPRAPEINNYLSAEKLITYCDTGSPVSYAAIVGRLITVHTVT